MSSLLIYFQKFLSFELWHNKGNQYLLSLGIFILFVIIFKIFFVIIINRLKKISQHTSTDVDDFSVSLVENIKPPFYLFISLYIAANFLTLSEIVRKILLALFLIVITTQTIFVLQKIIDFLVTKKILKKEENNRDKETAIKLLVQILKLSLWVVGIIVILSNFGIEVTSLIAGLGIGGIAVALALQNILSDIFASFSIFVDKPFKSGDFIASGTDMGTVDRIGVKSTRLKTLEGQELVISNRELTESRIINYQGIEKRRVNFSLGVTYETPIAQLKKIPQLLATAIKSIDKTQLGRVHFKTYGDFSLNFEVVFYALTSDYNEYMDIRQEVNFKILEVFQKENIDFAYPTQTIYTSIKKQL